MTSVSVTIYNRMAHAEARRRNGWMNAGEYAALLAEVGPLLSTYGAPAVSSVATVFGYPIIRAVGGFVLWRACEWCQTKETPKDGRCVKCGGYIEGLA